MELQLYLAVEVDPVVLPGIARGLGDSSYAPAILDGASGVGKTQQFFALVKSKEHKAKGGIYLHPALPAGGAQPIYEEMAELSDMEALIDSLNSAKESVLKTGDRNTDPFSVSHLSKLIAKQDESICSAVFELFFKVLFVRDDSLAPRDELGEKEYKELVEKDYKVVLDELEGAIFFIDEALPEVSMEKAQNLRFLRNFGRAMKMRCVLASTAAVAANMACEKWTPMSNSRLTAATERIWAVVYIVWRANADPSSAPAAVASGPVGQASQASHVEELFPNLTTATTVDDSKQEGDHKTPILGKGDDDDPDGQERYKSMQACLREGRPWMQKLVTDELRTLKVTDSINEENLRKVVTNVGGQIITAKFLRAKNATDSQVNWMMGGWLEREEASLHSFRLGAPELVRSHFFEPAIRVSSRTNELHDGTGMGKVRPRNGPFCVSIVRTVDQNAVWWTVHAAETPAQTFPLPTGQTVTVQEFQGVEYMLKYCVQQCLAKEPLLAVALSRVHKVTAQQFSDSIYRTHQEATYVTGCQAHGQLHEQISFGALVAARSYCGIDPENAPSVQTFVKLLWPYLDPKPRINDLPPALNFVVEQPAKLSTKSEELGMVYLRLVWTEVADLDVDCERNQFKLDLPYKSEEADQLSEIVKKEAGEEKLMSTPAATAPAVGANSSTAPSSKRSTKKRKRMRFYVTWTHLDGESDPGAEAELTTLKNLMMETKMPVLVPACSTDKLRSAVDRFPKLFDGMDIAGLVPGSTGARCDADAYSFQVDTPRVWAFEMKSRSTDYSRNKAMTDLLTKLTEPKETNTAQADSHAMMIASKATGTPECLVWRTGSKRLRVVLLLPCAIESR